MSYEKQTWQTGDVVTADKLNHMEDGIVDATGYTEEFQPIINETVNTVMESSQDPYAIGFLTYSTFIDSYKIKVTFEGQEYTLPKVHVTSRVNLYGEMDESTGEADFSTYPLAVMSQYGHGNALATEHTGNYSIKVEESVLVPTEEFKTAVNNSVPGSLLIQLATGGGSITSTATYQQIIEAIQKGSVITAVYGGLGTRVILRLSPADSSPIIKIDFSHLSVVQDTVQSNIEYFTVSDQDVWSHVTKTATLQTV